MDIITRLMSFSLIGLKRRSVKFRERDSGLPQESPRCLQTRRLEISATHKHTQTNLCEHINISQYRVTLKPECSCEAGEMSAKHKPP